MIVRLYLFILFAFSANFIFSQTQDIIGAENGTNLNVLYRNEAMGKVYANTRGFGASYRRAKHVTDKTRSFYEIDFQTLKHPKEVKVIGEAQERKRFVYGKLNSVLLMRGSVGLQHAIFSKADHKAVEVRYSYSIGPTLAFAKPYYLQKTNNFRNELLNQPPVKFNAETFTPDSVIGRGQFSDGLSELKIYPGATAKFNLSFEYAPYTNLIRAIETGISLDFFPKALPIIARNPNENFIITFYVGFVFGKKWM
jgi:hypothetical protein